MNDLDLLIHAKGYVEKLANGVNPLDDKPVSDEDIINNVRISRCLFYVSKVLDDVINKKRLDQDLHKESENKKLVNFGDFQYSEKPLTLSELGNRINVIALAQGMKHVKKTAIIGFLMSKGFIVFDNVSKIPSSEGLLLGLTVENKISQSGFPYRSILYGLGAQKYIVKNISEIADKESCKYSLNAGTAWSIEDDEILKDLYSQKQPLLDIANTMGRTVTALKARLVRLGVIEKRSDA